MKILITGVNGQVGHELMRALTDHKLIGLTRKDCDLNNLDQIKQVIDQHRPDLIINPAAYTHTSVAIHDALKAVDVPSVEIHLSQPAKRESFRRRSYVAEAVHGTVSGFGADSYVLGLQALSNLL